MYANLYAIYYFILRTFYTKNKLRTKRERGKNFAQTT